MTDYFKKKLIHEFAKDIRKYSISSIDLNDAAPQVIEDWKR